MNFIMKPEPIRLHNHNVGHLHKAIIDEISSTDYLASLHIQLRTG